MTARRAPLWSLLLQLPVHHPLEVGQLLPQLDVLG